MDRRVSQRAVRRAEIKKSKQNKANNLFKISKGTHIMKSLEELKAIKAKMQDKVSVRTSSGDIRIVVGMATCGIAAGARPVLNAFVEGITDAGLSDKVMVSQTGCIGICQYEPVVEIYEKDKEKVTYVKMTPEKAAEVIEKHVKGGNVITEYTIGAAKI